METAQVRDDHHQSLLGEQRSSQDDIELTELNDGRASDLGLKFGTEPSKTGISVVLVITILAITVFGYTVNTEVTVYFEDRLDWRKPFAIMYITHGSLILPWLCHVIYLRWSCRHLPFRHWCVQYLHELRGSIATVNAYVKSDRGIILKGNGRCLGPIQFLSITMGYSTIVMTVSGISWFCALALTTPADLTAIYNCSTFFAAVFSVPILRERLSWISIAAVGISLLGTFIIAYGDTTGEHSESAIGTSRLLGNGVACVGAIAFGLFEVLMKKWASPSGPGAIRSSLALTLAASALTGFYTLATLWVGLIVLHYTGVEIFVVPDAYTCIWIAIAVLAASFGIVLLVLLVAWTDPVFGSMANVLTVFFVAFADWIVWGLEPSFATYVGGAMILIAFAMLSKDSLGKDKY